MKKVFFVAIALVLFLPLLLLLTSALSPSQYPLEKNKYESIEQLHTALADDMNTERADKWVTDFYPRELAFYLNFEDKWFVFCSYSDLPSGEINKDTLLCYVVYEDGGKFSLDCNVWGLGKFAELPLHSDYTHWSYDRYYIEWNNTGESIGFAFKNKNEYEQLYYDGIKMNEMEAVNPFTNESFVVCYARSSVTHNVIKRIFVDGDKRHSLEIN